MKPHHRGALIIIGGHEDKSNGREILTEVSRKAAGRDGHLLIVTAATGFPKEVAEEYQDVFRKLGVAHVQTLDVRSRGDAHEPAAVAKVREASVVFFTGGDQLRITSQIGDTPVYRTMMERFEKGATIAGTSAGAAAMAETMIVSGSNDESSEISTTGMAPGLALAQDLVIDSHFAERGRFGRLLGAIAQNPRNLGLGIDENTAVVLQRDRFRVLGSGAVYAMDGSGITYSSLSESHPAGVLSIYDVKLHVLANGDRFDLLNRRPLVAESAADNAS